MKIQSHSGYSMVGKSGVAATALAIAFCALNPGTAKAASMISNIYGSPEPTQLKNAPLDGQTSIQNGDFTITRSGANSTLGNGVDELTTWGFDFTNSPNLHKFQGTKPLKSALLTLTLSPKSGLFPTDIFGIPGVGSIYVPNIPNLPELGQTGTLQLDLLDYGFTSAGILDGLKSAVGSNIGLGGGQVFQSSNAENVVPFRYSDDAIISYAELKLETVPEPTVTLGLLGLGIAGIAARRRKQQS